MLTKNDLSQIRGVVQEETRKIVQSETRKIVQEELVPVKKSLAKIDKRLTDTINFFDKKYLDHEGRIKTIERNLNLNPNPLF